MLTVRTGILFVAIAALFAGSVFAQRQLTGNVVDVVDGKTLVIESGSGRLTAQLQYIDVPDEGQPLHDVVKDHLSKLALGKAVEFTPVRMVGPKTIVQIRVDGVDLALQMIRDGAAWHEPKEISGQRQLDAVDYEANQTSAKTEKRGVWSGAILKTPWQVRAEKENHERAVKAARRLAHPTPVGVGEFHSDTRRPSGNHTPQVSKRAQMNNWVDVFSGASKEGYGLLTYADPHKRFNAVYTSASFFDFGSKDGKERLECRLVYLSMNRSGGGQDTQHLIGFRAISDSYRFSNARARLAFVIDGRTVALGAPYGWRRNGAIGAEEIIIYRVSWATLRKIANAKNVELRIGNNSRAPLSSEARELFKQLTDATS